MLLRHAEARFGVAQIQIKVSIKILCNKMLIISYY